MPMPRKKKSILSKVLNFLFIVPKSKPVHRRKKHKAKDLPTALRNNEKYYHSSHTRGW